MKRKRWLAAAALLVALVAGVLASLPGARPSSHGSRDDRSPEGPSRRVPWWSPERHSPSAAAPRAQSIAPWDATPDRTPDPGPGYLAAWKVAPPRPAELPLPPVREPPDPQVTRPPSLNPGGVDGDRPSRPPPDWPRPPTRSAP